MRCMKTLRYAHLGLLLVWGACGGDGVTATAVDNGSTAEPSTSGDSQTGTGADEAGNVVDDNIAHCGEAEPLLLSTCGNSQAEPGEYCVSSTAFELPVQVAGGYLLALGDFDDDGFDDMLASGAFYRGSAQGLAFGDVYYSGMAKGSLAVSDINGDDKPDIVYTSKVFRSDDPVFGMLAEEDFPNNFEIAAFPGPSGPGYPRNHRVAIADVDVDGRADVVVTYESSDTGELFIEVAKQKSGSQVGTFEAPVRITEHPRNLLTPLHAVRDVDLDGDPDIVADKSLFRNDGTGTFSVTKLNPGVVAELQFACGSLPVGAVVEARARYDLPIVGYKQGDATLGVFLDADAYYYALGAAPINQDTAYDVILTDESGTYISFGLGDGGFAAPLEVSTNLARRVGFHDINADGRLDFVLLSQTHVEVFLVGK